MDSLSRQQAAQPFSALPPTPESGDLSPSDLKAIDAEFGIRQGTAPVHNYLVQHKLGKKLLGEYTVQGTHSFAVADEAHARLCSLERGDYVLVTDLGQVPRCEVVRPVGAVPIREREDLEEFDRMMRGQLRWTDSWGWVS